MKLKVEEQAALAEVVERATSLMASLEGKDKETMQLTLMVLSMYTMASASSSLMEDELNGFVKKSLELQVEQTKIGRKYLGEITDFIDHGIPIDKDKLAIFFTDIFGFFNKINASINSLDSNIGHISEMAIDFRKSAHEMPNKIIDVMQNGGGVSVDVSSVDISDILSKVTRH